ncbi:hypothetical protein HYH03_005276 [Edaphochlamys debaryana]|uniref:Carbohydrate kinase PfkB domain-containing protein n=1 Tax=Edaphochlamys debaryana TaxID=47281 RepID=A0A835Y5T2_9CHLO|nr:hypothetical protein HYH03_005276 [Edaphochlamys debaryana]|eukprot:KAG2496877.1 hypothetical protein HYH03_005276 [Edaphochlamys debaryana]
MPLGLRPLAPPGTGAKRAAPTAARSRLPSPAFRGVSAPPRPAVCAGRNVEAHAGAAGSSGRSVDVVGLGNLCVDAVLPMEELPPPDVAVRRRLLDTLTAAPPDPVSWEVGGNCNFMVAAARLGLRTASVGHIGNDVYGRFMDEVLREEGVHATTRIAPGPAAAGSGGSIGGGLDSTLICFVLVGPASQHAFCSRYDFGPWPLLEGIAELPQQAQQVLRSSRAVFTNGFIFDELPLHAVESACLDAISNGSAIFFDPGPRCQTMLEGPRRAALDLLLDLSAVVLMTEDEARVVTGLSDPEAAARAVLARPGARAQWAVVKMGAAGAVLCERAAPQGGHPSGSGNGSGNGSGHGNGSGNGSGGGVRATRMGSVKVEVVDTVGCGDSFAAAIVMGYINRWPADVTLALANAVGGATATGRGAGRNVARAEDVLRLLGEGAAGRSSGGAEAAPAFARARELLLGQLAAGAGRGALSAAA